MLKKIIVIRKEKPKNDLDKLYGLSLLGANYSKYKKTYKQAITTLEQAFKLIIEKNFSTIPCSSGLAPY